MTDRPDFKEDIKDIANVLDRKVKLGITGLLKVNRFMGRIFLRMIQALKEFSLEEIINSFPGKLADRAQDAIEFFFITPDQLNPYLPADISVNTESLAIVLEYLLMEIMDISLRQAKGKKYKRMTAEDVRTAVRNDSEMLQLFTDLNVRIY